ncbi:hypothetical protein IFM89_024966 [Coptis chinensis]|uniref:Ribosomal eL28/Mak16 domain-containing protein n=1 Tax=Coptis chinensis TaxID=261450 RepID=A0A835HZN2_9MAGN|nr:hypothetical protein IFM89_024966 [Coptis chinensis]
MHAGTSNTFCCGGIQRPIQAAMEANKSTEEVEKCSEGKPVLEDKLSEVATHLLSAYDNGKLTVAVEEGHTGLQKWVKSFGKSMKRKAVRDSRRRERSFVELATTKTKKQNQPGKLKHKSVMNKEFYRMAKAVSNQVGENHYRPDLKNAALARWPDLRSLKVNKSGAKKRNRQNVRIPGRK